MNRLIKLALLIAIVITAAGVVFFVRQQNEVHQVEPDKPKAQHGMHHHQRAGRPA